MYFYWSIFVVNTLKRGVDIMKRINTRYFIKVKLFVFKPTIEVLVSFSHEQM